MSRRQGFTLIEIMIVVAIVGLLVAVAVPSFTKTMRHLRLSRAARTVAMDLLLARQLAIKENLQYYVTFTLADEIYKVYQIPRDGSGDVKIKEVNLTTDDGMGVENDLYTVHNAASGDITRLNFAPNGTVSISSGSTPVEITLRRTDATTDDYVLCARWSGSVRTRGPSETSC